jgi:ferredoxin/coenzyme F420-reducing hydrogenase delta subunit
VPRRAGDAVPSGGAVKSLQRFLRLLLERLEGGFDRIFGPAGNPFHRLGALGWFYYWIVLVSGIYLFIFFDTGVHAAYDSVEYLTHAQWYAGGVMRSLHRYASDALVVVMLIHLLREFAFGRLYGPRSLAWLTGVPIVWFVYASGVTGYWLVWDKLAQYVAIVTTEWLDTLGIFGKAIARNFLNPENLSDRFFTLMVFMHIAVPLFLLFTMWIHIQRIAKPDVNPPKALALGNFAALVVLSLVFPALSQGPADLDRIPAEVNLDWFYLGGYPLLDHLSGLTLWAIVGAASVLLFVMPWLLPRRHAPVAVVDLPNCNGCGRCGADCPYAAIQMQPRSDGLPYAQEALVDAGLCVSCGLCVGACPTATPFRKRSELIAGIELPQLTAQTLRDEVVAATEGLSGNTRVLVLGCQGGPDLRSLASSAVAPIVMPCVGQLPPAFLDFIITRGYADGVLFTGCREGACDYRFGIEWTGARIAGERDPRLRARVPRDRIRRCWCGSAGGEALAKELAAFREHLAAQGPYTRPASAVADVQTAPFVEVAQ